MPQKHKRRLESRNCFFSFCSSCFFLLSHSVSFGVSALAFLFSLYRASSRNLRIAIWTILSGGNRANHRAKDLRSLGAVTEANSYPILSYRPDHIRPVPIVNRLTATSELLSSPVILSCPTFSPLATPSNLILGIEKIPQPLFILLGPIVCTRAFMILLCCTIVPLSR